MKTSLTAAAGAIALAAFLPASSTWACSSCGCTLNADWSSQGFNAAPGLGIDLRHDHFVQDDLRSGTGRVGRASITLPADREIQGKTVNRNTTLTLDYGFDADWGVSIQVPYLDRYHTTVAEGDTELSTSNSSSLGDVRMLARYQGFAAARDGGVQFGLKLPTGGTGVNFNGGPQAGSALDRGLQPGTGSTDLLLGMYTYGALGRHVEGFGQALLQLPLTSKDDFKPGAGLNLTAGLRYVTDGPVVPHVQINVRSEKRESGANADAANSGATLVYLSPGATWAVNGHLKAYAFVQAPIHQRVTGLQIEPRISASLGMHYAY